MSLLAQQTNPKLKNQLMQKEARDAASSPVQSWRTTQSCEQFIYARMDVPWEDGWDRSEDHAGMAGFALGVVSFATNLG